MRLFNSAKIPFAPLPYELAAVYKDEKLDDKTAVKWLYRCLETPGMLKIITSLHACGVGPRPRTEIQWAKCLRFPVPQTQPAHFVCHDVVRLERHPIRAHQIRAFSKEGDITIGEPRKVLRRLLQYHLAGIL